MKRGPTKALGELVAFVGGGTPRRDCPSYWGGDIPWASVKDLQSEVLDTTLESITADGLANSASNLISEGTVIIATRVGLGKVAINQRAVAINQDLKALIPRCKDLLPRFLLLFLLSKAEYFERIGIGTTVKGLTLKDYQTLKLFVPTLAEQERIVKLLEGADELRKLRAQADRRTIQMIPALFYEMFGNSRSKGWSFVRLGEVAPIVRRPVHVDLLASYPEVGIRSFGKGTFHKPSLSGVDVGGKRIYRVEPGDLLFSNVFAWEGAIAVAKREDSGRFASHRFITCVPKASVASSDFLCSYFLTAGGLGKIGEASPGGAGRNRTLGLDTLSRIGVPLPPLPLQKEFGQRLIEIRELEAAQAACRRRVDDLLQSLLHHTFGR